MTDPESIVMFAAWWLLCLVLGHVVWGPRWIPNAMRDWYATVAWMWSRAAKWARR